MKKQPAKEIEASLMQTLQNEDAFFTLQKADSILGAKNNGSGKISEESPDKINDTTLSLMERLTSGNATEMSAEEYKIAHPLTGVLYPFISQNENGENVLANSSFIGFSTIEDTNETNKYLALNKVKNLFPASIKFLWSRSIHSENILNLTATTDSCKAINFVNSDIENLIIKEKNEPFKIIKSVIGNKKYTLSIKFKSNTSNKFNDFFRDNSSNLLTVQLNGNIYRNSITKRDFLNEIVLAEDLKDADIDSIKVNYYEFFKQE